MSSPVKELISSLAFSLNKEFLMINDCTGANMAHGPPSYCTKAVFSNSLNEKAEIV